MPALDIPGLLDPRYFVLDMARPGFCLASLGKMNPQRSAGTMLCGCRAGGRAMLHPLGLVISPENSMILAILHAGQERLCSNSPA